MNVLKTIPMTSQVAAVSCGLYNGKAVLDLVGYSNLACNIHPNTYKLTFVANVRG